MGRIYTVSFSGVAATASQDLFEVKAGAGKPFILHELIVTQDTDYGDAQAEGFRVKLIRATGAYTTGSGGSTPTASPHQTSDTAAGVTAKVNNTTAAVAGSGALTTLRAEAFNIQAGWQYLPVPEDRIFFAAGSNAEACILNLVSTPADSVTLSGSMVFEELG